MKNMLVPIVLLAILICGHSDAQWNKCDSGFCSLASIGSSGAFTTFAPATLSNATLSNGNLTVTGNGGGVGGAASTSYKSSGKFCVSFTINQSTANTDFIGIQDNTVPGYPAVTNGSPGHYAGWWIKNNQILNSGGSQGALQAAGVNGNSLNIAVDIGNGTCWYQLLNPTAGNWNNDASANPATNTNGKVCAYTNVAPMFGISNIGSPSTGDGVTANFGATACSGQLPSGFSAGWPQ